MDPDEVVLLDLDAVVHGVADRVGDFAGLDVLDVRVHVGEVLLGALGGVEHRERGVALGDRLRGEDVDLLLFDDLRRRFGGEEDVLVVGDDDHGVGIDRIARLDEILDRGIHRLAAFDDEVAAHLDEGFLEAVAVDDGDDRVFLLDARRGGGGVLVAAVAGFALGVGLMGRLVHHDFGMLDRHVLDLEVDEEAEALAEVQDVAGGLRMDVDLQDVVVLDADERVAERIDHLDEILLAEFVDLRDLHDELGAVAVVPVVLEGLVVEDGLRLGRLGGGLRSLLGGVDGIEELLALDRVHHPAHDLDVAGAAGVDHADLFQDRQQVGGAGERGFELDHVGLEQRFELVLRRAKRQGAVGAFAGDRQHRALDGVDDGRVGLFDAGAERFREGAGVGFGDPLEAVGEAAEELREDDAGVAPRPHQHAPGDRLGDDADRRFVDRRDGFRARGHGRRHVGAGVAVRDREDVQFVDAVDVVAQLDRAVGHHALEQAAVDQKCVHLESSGFDFDLYP